MRIRIGLLSLPIFISLLAVGCSNSLTTSTTETHTTEKPNAKEVLTLDLEADLFQFDGVIYQTGIDRV